MCINKGNMDIFIPNVKFLHLALWLEWVCTDDANTNDDAQSMIVYGFLVDKPNEPKTKN